jgi:DNA repair exonuclease SbcCD nuclease subunit
MSTLRADLIFVADIHLQHNAPVARAGEDNWYDAMRRPLKELRHVVEKTGATVICAGDIFDRWNAPPELINFALEELPDMCAIPGQHDLPLHNIKDVHKSAYWTLVEAGKVKHLDKIMVLEGSIMAHPFQFGETIKECKKNAYINICVAHQYVWWKEHGYTGAPNEQRFGNFRKILNTYDAVLLGDNHKGWLADDTVLNCGTLIRRKTDEKEYKPCIGLYDAEEKIITRYFLNTSNDILSETAETKPDINDETDVKKFIQELAKLGRSELDFVDALEQYVARNKVVRQVKDILVEVLNEHGIKI